MKRLVLVAAATSLFGVGTSAFAQQGLHPGFYVLGGLGQARMDINQGELDAASLAVGNGVPSSVSNTETGWKLGVGYQFNQYFGVEGTYVDFGKPSYSNPAPGPYVGVNLHPTSWNLFGVGRRNGSSC